jgi:hypothetical protein
MMQPGCYTSLYTRITVTGHTLGWLLALAHCLLRLYFLVDSWFFTAHLIWLLSSDLPAWFIWSDSDWNALHPEIGFSYTEYEIPCRRVNYTVIQVVATQRLSHFYKNTCLASRCLAMDFNIPAFRHYLPSIAQHWSWASHCLAMDTVIQEINFRSDSTILAFRQDATIFSCFHTTDDVWPTTMCNVKFCIA